MHGIHVPVGICQITVILDPFENHLVLFQIDHFQLPILHLCDLELLLILKLSVHSRHDSFLLHIL